MTIPLWTLLGFAAWTLLTLFGTIGVIRWSQILTGRAPISSFRADEPQGSDLYRRAMRAHANCVENLPVYGAVVVCVTAAGIEGSVIDALAVIVLLGRIGQTVTHVALPATDLATSVRFVFFFIQAASMVAMGVTVAVYAA